MTTVIPEGVMIALPREEKPSNIEYQPVQVFYFSETNYTSGMEKINTPTGSFKIYDREKTIVDCYYIAFIIYDHVPQKILISQFII
jgi:hypothetical protein